MAQWSARLPTGSILGTEPWDSSLSNSDEGNGEILRSRVHFQERVTPTKQNNKYCAIVPLSYLFIHPMNLTFLPLRPPPPQVQKPSCLAIHPAKWPV